MANKKPPIERLLGQLLEIKKGISRKPFCLIFIQNGANASLVLT
jgi:hypothetical protein